MFRPGKTWLDTDGNAIQAHGGGVNFFNGRYYWYGENKTGCSAKQSEGKPWHAGANCYSSSDLYNWTLEGTVLPATSPDFSHELNPRRIMDRPHVLFNKVNENYVMWVKLVPADWHDQHVGVATLPSATGPFTLKKIVHPNGMCAGDANLFAEAADGKAYYVFGRPHTEVVVADLTPDYLDTTGMYSCHFPQPGDPWGREAPAIFKRRHTYYMITSGTTGYRPNEAQWASAPLIHGPGPSTAVPASAREAARRSTPSSRRCSKWPIGPGVSSAWRTGGTARTSKPRPTSGCPWSSETAFSSSSGLMNGICPGLRRRASATSRLRITACSRRPGFPRLSLRRNPGHAERSPQRQ